MSKDHYLNHQWYDLGYPGFLHPTDPRKVIKLTIREETYIPFFL